jgi:hypothetical protein
LRIEYKDATLAATKLSKNKPQNKQPQEQAGRHFAVPTTDGLKQARESVSNRPARREFIAGTSTFESASNHHAGTDPTPHFAYKLPVKSNADWNCLGDRYVTTPGSDRQGSMAKKSWNFKIGIGTSTRNRGNL